MSVRVGSVLLLTLVACGDGEPLPEFERGAGRVGGEVVSTVHGHPILLDDVEALARSANLSPEDALHRLQAETLLGLEAERRGYADDVEIRRAAVHAFLARFEARFQPSDATQAEVEAWFERRRPEFRGPETRTFAQIVVQVDVADDPGRWEEAAWLARRLRGEWVTDAATWDRYRVAEELEGFALNVDIFEDSVQDGALEASLDAAVFGAYDVGVVSDIIRTSIGWHVVAVREIQPPPEIELADFEEQVRDEIVQNRRSARLGEFVAELGQRHGIVQNERQISRLMELELDLGDP